MLLSSSRLRQILSISLPLMGGMISQNLLNLIDTAMVGHLGTTALAATGFGGFANFLCTAMITGLAAGVQTIAARRYGELNTLEAAVPLNGGIFLALVVGAPLTFLLYQCVPYFFPLLIDDPAVVSEGVPYLQIRLFALVAMGINFSSRGFWSGISRSGIYMLTLVVMHLSNILLNYLLIFGNGGFPRLGVQGAALASAISVWIGSVLYLSMGFKSGRQFGFFKKLPDREGFRNLIRLTVPMGVQQTFLAAGVTMMFWIIGKIGTHEVAATTVMINIMLVAYLPGMGLGLGAASLVGQALGRKDPQDAMAWGWDTVKVGVVLLGALGLPMLFFTRPLLGLFLHDQSAVELAIVPLRIMGAGMALEGVSRVLMHALIGAGDAKLTMKVSILLQWVYFLPLAFLVGPYFGGGLVAVWLANLSWRVLLTTAFVIQWRRGGWQEIQV